MASADCDTGALVTGFEAARRRWTSRPWAAVEALDLKIPAEGQMALFRRLTAALRGARPSGWPGGPAAKGWTWPSSPTAMSPASRACTR